MKLPERHVPDAMFSPDQGNIRQELRRAGVKKQPERMRLLVLEDLRLVLDCGGDTKERDLRLR